MYAKIHNIIWVVATRYLNKIHTINKEKHNLTEQFRHLSSYLFACFTAICICIFWLGFNASFLTPQCRCRIASESVERFKQGARLWLADDRPRQGEMRSNRRNRLHYNVIGPHSALCSPAHSRITCWAMTQLNLASQPPICIFVLAAHSGRDTLDWSFYSIAIIIVSFRAANKIQNGSKPL